MHYFIEHLLICICPVYFLNLSEIMHFGQNNQKNDVSLVQLIRGFIKFACLIAGIVYLGHVDNC